MKTLPKFIVSLLALVTTFAFARPLTEAQYERYDQSKIVLVHVYRNGYQNEPGAHAVVRIAGKTEVGLAAVPKTVQGPDDRAFYPTPNGTYVSEFFMGTIHHSATYNQFEPYVAFDTVPNTGIHIALRPARADTKLGKKSTQGGIFLQPNQFARVLKAAQASKPVIVILSN